MEPTTTRDVYNIVTDHIIELLEKGIIPWKQPWKDIGVPRNFVTQRPYRGLNQLLLSVLNFPHNEFLTFNQVQHLGGRVKKGEKANLVILWVWVDEKGNDRMHELKGRKWPLLRYYVFNITQCTGIPVQEPLFEANANTPIEKCEAIVANMPNCPKIVHQETEAFYSPSDDFINMPKMEVFETSYEYYATLFHELIHATGHETRLKRRKPPEQSEFGSENYSIEELTAEIGSCYLTSHAGIAMNVLDNSVAYIQHWLGKLKSDKKFIVHASAYAQNAVDYILNIKFEENEVASHLQNEVV